MTEQEVRDLITFAFAEAADQNWSGNLLKSVTNSAVKVAKERGFIKEEKFCEHGFISGSNTCSVVSCGNFKKTEKRCTYVSDIDNARCIGEEKHTSFHYFDNSIGVDTAPPYSE